MADAAARREERRRKITQNAEARMNKLLGKQVEVDPEKSPQVLAEEKVTSATEDVPSEPPVSSSPYNLRQRPSRATSSISRDSSPMVARDAEELSERQSTSASSMSSLSADSHGNGAARLSCSPTTETKENSTTIDENGSLQSAVAGLRTLEMIHVGSCVFTAFITRYILAFGIGIFYFQTIVLPFVMMELTLAYLSHTHLKYLGRPSSKGTMWSAALMLCGIKQELIESYNIIMGRVAATMNNFCLYAFSFIVWNAVFG